MAFENIYALLMFGTPIALLLLFGFRIFLSKLRNGNQNSKEYSEGENDDFN